MTSDRGMFLYAKLVGRPNSEYGTFIFDPVPEAQTFSFTGADLLAFPASSPPWDPSLLDAVTFRLADGVGPFRLCISRLAFE